MKAFLIVSVLALAGCQDHAYFAAPSPSQVVSAPELSTRDALSALVLTGIIVCMIMDRRRG